MVDPVMRYRWEDARVAEGEKRRMQELETELDYLAKALMLHDYIRAVCQSDGKVRGPQNICLLQVPYLLPL